jgi:hypothetical protein
MQFVDVCIEYPSGISIIDRGSYDAELGMVYVSARVRAFLAVMHERIAGGDHRILGWE